MKLHSLYEVVFSVTNIESSSWRDCRLARVHYGEGSANGHFISTHGDRGLSLNTYYFNEGRIREACRIQRIHDYLNTIDRLGSVVITITVVQQGQRIRFAHAFQAEIDWRIIVVGNDAGLVISRIEGYRTIRGTITTPVSRGITENRVAFTGRVATSIQALWNIPWDIIAVDLALEVSFCRRTTVEVDQGLFQCQLGMSMRDG